MTSGLGVLTPHLAKHKRSRGNVPTNMSTQTHPKAPVVPKTPVGTNLLQALKILTELVVQKVRKDLGSLDVPLSVDEVIWDLVLAGVEDDSDDSLDLLLAQFTSRLAHVHVGLQQNNK